MGLESPRRQDEHPCTDRLIRWALKSHYADIAAWLLGSRPSRAGPLGTELSGPVERRADNVLDVRYEDRPSAILHIEWEMTGGAIMARRMTWYTILIDEVLESPEHRGNEAVAVVVYLDRRSYRPDPGRFHKSYSPGHRLYCSYRRVFLWEEDPEPVLAAEIPGVWPFTVLMRGDPVGLFRASRERILGAPDTILVVEEKPKLLTLLGGLASRLIDDPVLLKRLRTEVRGMGDNLFLDLFVEDGRRIGLEQGREQGLQQGLQQGIRAAVLRVLRRRFGELAPELERRLEAIADVGRLESLAAEAAVAPSLEAFARLHPQPGS